MKYKTGLIFGTFDPLHYGHIRLFKRAKKLCERLVVCTESNRVIEKEKHKAFTTEKERVEDIKGIKYVDEVIVRKGSRKVVTDKIKPDVLFLGDDWKNKDWAGKKLGIPIIYLKRTKEISSTLCRNTLGNI